MPSWNDLGSAFSTLRELDVSAIREESERPVTIACLGELALARRAVELLRITGSRRFGPVGRDPFLVEALPAGEPDERLRRVDLLLVAVDGRAPVSAATASALARLARLAVPTAIVICGVQSPLAASAPRPEFAHAHIAVVPDLEAPAAAEALAAALLERLPAELHLAAARAVPGLRPVYARELISSVSVTNASYALASALPEQIPVLSVPFAAADILVLTKNQALLVYRLALAHGAPPEFQARMAEIAPVVGGAFVWRQLARTLVGLIPIWGVVPKVAISYAGTYTTGVAAWRWFAEGELVSGERLKQIADEAMVAGRARAETLLAAAREKGAEGGGRVSAALRRLRERLPGRKRKPAPLASPEGGEKP